MNTADLLILLGIGAAVFLALRSILRRRKSGGCSCGCSCCSASCAKESRK
ncbi:MAG: FeoB-associated Cys-rich membrane protein [Clostridia bacterium]|nr:FeoB-associated Cys-rich membrane protein [Clostridia bacterium]